MKDLENAKELFYSGDWSFVLVKDGAAVKSSKKGLSPIVELIESGKDFTDCTICDKTTGRAAAFLYVLLGAKEVHALRMTNLAVQILDKAEIKFSADEFIESVHDETMTCTDACESAVLRSGSAAQAFKDIKKALETLS